MEQRTPEWRRARIGIPTASCFEKIVTASGSPSSQAQGYMCRLIAERIFGRPMEEDISHLKWVAHGNEFEDEAVREFESVSGESTEQVGFVTTEDGRLGCSPDRLIAGRNAALEIKCPSPWKHVEYTMYGPGKDYKPQVQGQMLVGGYDLVYFFSYFPGMPCKVWKYERDGGFILTLGVALTVFNRELEKETKKFQEMYDTDLWDYDRALDVISKLMPEEV